ncbi:MAG: IS110 family transposase [Methanomassiliicoccaceae archaeon]|jgi:transposase|nr:IS110 family transposase [Methanomassiliicoccaceae archaeon]
MRYIGLDVHKKNTTACVISAGGKVLKEMEVPSSADGLAAIRDFMGNHEYCVMMESSTYAYPVYRYFDDLGIQAHVVHARSLKVVTDSTKKTDKKDARTIGIMLRLWKKKEIDELKMSFIPTREQCELKDICRYREEVSAKIGDESRRIRSHLERNCQPLPYVFSDLKTRIAREYIRKAWPEDLTLQRRLNMFEELLTERDSVAKNIGFRMPGGNNVGLLEKIVGVGRQTAIQIMSMIIDIDRFDDPEKLCAYFGMVPRVHDSGGKERRGRMTKEGDKMMRMIMERVTLTHIQYCDSAITRYYNRKLPEMGVKKALITASRKMQMVIYATLKIQRPFRTT